MHTPDDYDQFWLEQDREPEYTCDDCHKARPTDGDDVCAPCRARRDAEELAFPNQRIPLITQKPVDGPTFAEMRRVLEKLP